MDNKRISMDEAGWDEMPTECTCWGPNNSAPCSYCEKGVDEDSPLNTHLPVSTWRVLFDIPADTAPGALRD